MTMLKMLVLSNLLDPIVSLQELIDAFRDADEIASEDAAEAGAGRPDARDVAVRNLTIAI